MIIEFNDLKHCFCNLQPKECPICSWVNKKDGQPAISFIDFTPKKKSKGIVFYEDRMIELEESPHLARGAVLLTAVKEEVKVEVKEEQLPSSLLDDLLSPLKKVKKTRKSKVPIITPDISIKAEVDVDVDVEGSAASASASASGSKSKIKSKSKKRIEMESKELDFSSPVAVKRKRTAHVMRNMLETPRPKERSVAEFATECFAAEVPEEGSPAEDCMVRVVCAPGLESKELFKIDEECPAKTDVDADGQLSSAAESITGLPPVMTLVDMLDHIERVVDDTAMALTAEERILGCKLESAATSAAVEAVTAAAVVATAVTATVTTDSVQVKVKMEVIVEEGSSTVLSRALTRSRSKRKSID